MGDAQGAVSVGIVMRTRDRPLFVLRALASVAAQTYDNWQIVLVNDGGDPTALNAAIAASALPPALQERLTRKHLAPGVGRSAAFNTGVAALETELVACLDDDDTWAPEFLARLTGFYAETMAKVPDLGGVAARVIALREEIVETETGNEIRVIGEEGLPASFHRPEFFVNPLAYACYRQDLYPVQWLIRRDAVQAVGGFPETFDVMEDRAFLNRLLAHYRMGVLDEKLAFHHRRTNRTRDDSRNALMNTLDNPSYDWRLYSDLARPAPDLQAPAPQAALMRSLLADLLAEVNYETSAIWQKVDGDFRSLSRRLDSDKAEMLARLPGASARPAGAVTSPQALPAIAAVAQKDVAFDLWQAHGAHAHAQHVIPGARFCDRLELSHSGDRDGLLLHVAPDQRLLELQVPRTGPWCAVELALEDLAAPGGRLRCHLQLWSQGGYLFESALTHLDPQTDAPDHHAMADFTVHSCSNGRTSLLTRDIPAQWLAAVRHPKLSLILPRHAQHFRFIAQNIVVERIAAV